MLIREFSPEWKLWIWQNIVQGIDKESVFNVLLNYGFEYSLIQRELEYEPVNPLVWKRQYSQENMGEIEEEEITPLHKRLADNPLVFRVDTHLLELYYLPDFLKSEDCDKIIEDYDIELPELDNTIHRTFGFDMNSSGGISVEQPQTVRTIPHDVEWRMFIFLNDTNDDGAELFFPHINKRFTPRQGDAYIWKLQFPSGATNVNQMIEFDSEDEKLLMVEKWIKYSEVEAQVIDLDITEK